MSDNSEIKVGDRIRDYFEPENSIDQLEHHTRRNQLRDAIAHHPVLAITSVGILLLAFKILRVAGGNTDTAVFLVKNTGISQALMASAILVFPVLIILVAGSAYEVFSRQSLNQVDRWQYAISILSILVIASLIADWLTMVLSLGVFVVGIYLGGRSRKRASRVDAEQPSRPTDKYLAWSRSKEPDTVNYERKVKILKYDAQIKSAQESDVAIGKIKQERKELGSAQTLVDTRGL